MVRVDEYRFSKRKTLAVCIDGTGRVIVRAPKGYPQKRIDAFLQDKEGWIEKHKRAKLACARALPTQVDGYELPFAGASVRLVVYEGKKRIKRGDVLYLPRSNPEKSLIAWIKKEGLALFEQRTAIWQGIMGVRATSVRVSNAQRKWGSCSVKNELRFAYRLAYAPIEIIDYVVVHELAHIRYKNHSSAFWAEVKGYMPDYPLHRSWLKNHAYLLQIF